MSNFKIKMRLSTNNIKQETISNKNQELEKMIESSKVNKNSFIKLWYSVIKRNYASLLVKGDKFCKSCNSNK